MQRARGRIAKGLVRVISMEIAETRRVDPGSLPDQAVVIAKTVCEHEDGVEEHIPVTWFLLWEEDGWRLSGIIPVGPPP